MSARKSPTFSKPSPSKLRSPQGKIPASGSEGRKSGAYQAAEKPFIAVILSAAKNRALSIFKALRDSSSPAAPQNDSDGEFFRSLLCRRWKIPACG
jgi:hypothetical protein